MLRPAKLAPSTKLAASIWHDERRTRTTLIRVNGSHMSERRAQQLVGTPLNEALEPTQLFEFAVELANFFLLMWMLNRKKFDGQVFGAYLILYGVARFLIEFLRGDPGRGEVFGGALSGTQVIALGLVILGGVIWWLKSARKTADARA